MMIVFVRSLLMFILLTECTGNKVIVQSNGSTAVLNKDFSFKCSLSHGNVKQVTWQKQKDKGLENVATYSVKFGPKVLEPYHQRVNFSLIGLNESSITIHNVQTEDEGCYMCLFNTYPEGSITGKSCFTVFGISEMNIEKFSTKSENIIVVSCSVTGKPSPMIAWQTSENITEHEMEIKEDDKGIVTIISNVTVDLSTFQAKEISCYAYLQNPTRPEERQEVEKTIIVRIRDVPSHVGTIVGVCGILLIIVTVIAVIVMPAVFVGNTRILSSSSVVFETFSE
ncbi:OX-2 membrane glycoprotein-like [Acipenser oxyrinchus oxyrinchus]|uniref:OX-2 membrane glycoprotein-like n=1 Tax=Acipenser oxyrinchus oxyrinchus TaxID=40147 RepID=A0AAD8CU26_ACIOX|nr:OX-2 membrane glycoprotein-like [Acipenser oxyrinchus oxyrinchus]